MIRINADKSLQCSDTFTCMAMNYGHIAAKDGFEWQPMQNRKQVTLIVAALDLILNKKIVGQGIDPFFESLPRRMSLTQIVDAPDRIVTISRSAKGTGAAETSVLAISIKDDVIAGRTADLAATILHELAHTSGADDFDDTISGHRRPAAERVLEASPYFKSKFVPSNVIAKPGSAPPGQVPRPFVPAIKMPGSL